MFIRGIVTEVNKKLLSFEIDNSIQVQMVLICLRDPSQKLPKIRATVSVTFTLFSTNGRSITSIILTPDCKIEGDFSTNRDESNDFMQVVTDFNLQPADLLWISDNYVSICTHFPAFGDVTEENLLVSLIQVLPKHSGLSLSKCSLKFLSQFNDNSSYINRFKDFSYWTFGNHRSCSFGEYLIGYLFIFQKAGMTYLTDFQRQSPCIFTNSVSDKISRFINCTVAIRDYVVITETYNCQSVHQIAYFLIDFKNVVVLCESSNLIKNTDTNCLLKEGYQITSCLINSKSMPIQKSLGRTEYWLHVTSERDQSDNYLCLKSSCSSFLLLPGFSYDHYFKEMPKKAFNKDISLLDSKAAQYELPPTSLFIPKERKPLKVLTISEALSHLAISSKTVSFQGKITLKKFANPLSSRTTKISKDALFGTPGLKTHMLEFKSEDNKVLTLYLNNWENTANPYCLITNMCVIVYNATPQKRNYYKSNIMTSFEVVKYQAEARFNTVDWSCPSWGVPQRLGVAGVPCGTIIWEKSALSFILGLKIFCSDNRKLDAQITLVTRDAIGESKVIAKNKYALMLLRLLPGLRQNLRTWWNNFLLLDGFVYSKGMVCNVSSDQTVASRKEAIRRKLIQHLNSVNEKRFRLDLMVRKLDVEASGKPVYFLLDARL